MAFIIPTHLARIIKTLGLLIAFIALMTISVSSQAYLSFTLPNALDPATMADDIGEDHAPQIATDGAGHWVAVWGAGLSIDPPEPPYGLIYVSRSEDNGLSWSTPVSLTTTFGIPRYSHIATDMAGAWVIAWIDSETLNTKGNVFFARSTDNGTTWSQPQGLCREGDTSNHKFLRIAADPDGAWLIAWESTDPAPAIGEPSGEGLGDDLDILFARSTDGGQTWSAPLPLNTTATTDNAAADRTVDMIPLGQGKWLAAWFSTNPLGETLGDDEDILFARSINDGATWSEPAALNSYAAEDSWIDITPRLTTDGQGNVVCCWVSSDFWETPVGSEELPSKALYISRSRDNGRNWQTAVQLKDDRGTPGTFNVTPDLHTDGRGLWMAGWTLTGGSLYLFMSTDQGANWNIIPRALGSTEEGVHNRNVSFATDETGNWVIGWDSNDPTTVLGETLGADYDIFVSTLESTYVEHKNAVSPLDWQLYE